MNTDKVNNRDNFRIDTNTEDYWDYNEMQFMESNNRKKKMLSMLGFLAIILVILIFVVALKISIDNKGDGKDINTLQTYQEDVPFSFGTINGNVYENRWADIQCSVNNEWKEATKEQYEAYKNEGTTCDFNVLSNDGCEIAILLIDLSKHPSLLDYSEDALINEISIGISSKIESVKVSKKSYQMLGNQLYLYADIDGKNDSKSVCVTSYLRKLDGYAIVVNISSGNAEKNHVLSNLIESCV